MRRLDNIGAVFLLSYCADDMFDELPMSWHKATISVRRHVAGFAKHRATVTELLISNRPLECLENNGQ